MNKRSISTGVILLLLFAVFTFSVINVDVKPVGCECTDIGFATVNEAVNKTVGANETVYKLSKYLGLMTWGVVAFFGLLGLSQLVNRKSLLKVDRDILALGCGYAVMLACYVLFEKLIINYRPATAGGELEASYPSSHTLMLVFVMATAIMQLLHRMKRSSLRTALVAACIAVATVVTLGRLIGGVHWLTDIVGGLLLAAALAALYAGFAFPAAATPQEAPTKDADA